MIIEAPRTRTAKSFAATSCSGKDCPKKSKKTKKEEKKSKKSEKAAKKSKKDTISARTIKDAVAELKTQLNKAQEKKDEGHKNKAAKKAKKLAKAAASVKKAVDQVAWQTTCDVRCSHAIFVLFASGSRASAGLRKRP